MVEIAPFFAVPFGFATHPNCAPLNGELRQLMAQRMAQESVYANPNPATQHNVQVFESRVDLFRGSERCLQQLKEFCIGQLLQYVCQLNNYDEAMTKRLLIYHESWFHITTRGGYFGLHSHPNASWSGVYCIDPGHPDPNIPGNGLLTFVSPTLTTSQYRDVTNSNMPDAFSPNVRSVKLAPGELVLFPSWLLHDVRPYDGEGERITVSFNAWFGLAVPN